MSYPGQQITICTKCIGTDHLTKYCNLYHMYPNNHELYVNEMIKQENYDYYYNKLINSSQYKLSLRLIQIYTIDEAVEFMMERIHYSPEVLQPFWNIMYKRFSKEEIQDYINLYNT